MQNFSISSYDKGFEFQKALSDEPISIDLPSYTLTYFYLPLGPTSGLSGDAFIVNEHGGCLNFLLFDAMGCGDTGYEFASEFKEDLLGITNSLSSTSEDDLERRVLSLNQKAGHRNLASLNLASIKGEKIKYVNIGENRMHAPFSVKYLGGKVGILDLYFETNNLSLLPLEKNSFNNGYIIFMYSDGILESYNGENMLKENKKVLKAFSKKSDPFPTIKKINQDKIMKIRNANEPGLVDDYTIIALQRK